MGLPEEVVQIPVARLKTFPEHPFYVRDDDMMQQLVESIRQVGVLMPIIVRRLDNECYEIISGHRRKHACELLEFDTVPAIIKEVDMNEATIMMVDSNLQREVILPSEKAKASYVDQTVQKWLCEYIHDNGVIKPEQIAALRSRLETGSINQSQMISILNESLKGRLPAVKVSLTEKKLRKYFPASYSSEDMEGVIIALLEEWKKSHGGA